jgi:molecular chaperone GrpE
MNDEQKKDMTPEQNPAENAVPEEKPAEDTEKESAVKQAADTEAEKGEESKEAEKKEKRRFGRKPSREEEKIAALEKEKANLNDKFLRICAEYDNFRKRSQKEKDALYGDIKANTVTQFLPVYDNLERALKQNTEDEAYKKGVEMIMTQFCSTLEKLGVTEIECLGEKFDPTMHNAVMHVDDEEKGENEIVEVFQKGFKLGEKVIRFAMVKVAN